MNEELVHYYHVILGRRICGAPIRKNRDSHTVFPERVTCPACLWALNGEAGKRKGI